MSAKSKKLEGKKCTDLIVLNLAWKTDEAALRDYFSRYGELVMVQVCRQVCSATNYRLNATQERNKAKGTGLFVSVNMSPSPCVSLKGITSTGVGVMFVYLCQRLVFVVFSRTVSVGG